MRGLPLDIFDFDYDVMRTALFLNASGKVYGRFGTSTAQSAGADHSLKGLRYAMEQALAWHAADAKAPAPPTAKPRFVEDLPASKRLPDKACIHCQNVYEFRRPAQLSDGTGKRDDVWVYPEPANIGLTLDTDQGNKVKRVASKSPAAAAAMAEGDVLRSLNGVPIASIADVRYALHRAPASGTIPIIWERNS